MAAASAIPAGKKSRIAERAVAEDIDSPVVCRLSNWRDRACRTNIDSGLPANGNLDEGVAIFRKTSTVFALLDHGGAHEANAASSESRSTMLIVRLLIEITRMIGRH